VNTRISDLRNRYFETIPEVCTERARYFTESMKQTEGEYIALRRAKAFAHVLENMTIFVADGEVIVGNQASKPRSAPVFPEYSIDWIINELDGKPYFWDKRPGDQFNYTKETKRELLDLVEYWRGKTVYENLRKNLPEECDKAWNMVAIDDTWVSSAALGNHMVDFEWVLKVGLNGVIRHAEEYLKKIDITQPDTIKKYWFLQSVIIANKAAIRFAERFADECLRLSNTVADEKRKAELKKLADICRNVPANPARTFWEGVQSVWFVLLLQHIESNGHANSIGRFDQYLFDLYQKDISEKRMTRDEALELVDAFIIKCNELNKLRSWPDTSMFLGYHMAINLAVGGQKEDGSDAVNDLSYLVLEACGDIKLFTPSISVKWFEGTDDAFIEKALEIVQVHKGGMPAFYNDKAFIRTLLEMGIDKKDAWNWAPVGCIEATIPGKWDFAAKGPWLSVGKLLEITLNNGKDPATGITLLPGDGDLSTFKSINEVFNAYKKQLHYFMELQVITEHINDEMHKVIDINAFTSSLVHDCIERGTSLIEGGSVYSADGGPTAGTITAGDSLAAIEAVVFEKKLLTGAQLLHALNTNFEDNTTTPTGEEIRQIVINKAPKFGNDDDSADKWSVKVADFIGSSYRNDFKNSRYGKGPVPCCYSYSQSPVTGNVSFGAAVGATPNGRKAGKPVNNGVSPSNGSEVNGATAAINSVAKLPSIWFQKGAIFNMRLGNGVLTSKEGRGRVTSMIKVLFEKYGEQIQFNVVDNQTLKDAKAHPENYRDLLVRVSGYSCLFTPLDPRCQDDLIERLELDV
jgi:pyruvate formate-lyase/glycerol dehydratase family glycyl radical enzyme